MTFLIYKYMGHVPCLTYSKQQKILGFAVVIEIKSSDKFNNHLHFEKNLPLLMGESRAACGELGVVGRMITR